MTGWYGALCIEIVGDWVLKLLMSSYSEIRLQQSRQADWTKTVEAQ